MTSFGLGRYVVVVLHVEGTKLSNVKLVLQREPRTGKTWFPAGSVTANEEHVDVAVRELHEETPPRQTPPISTMAVFVLPKWAKFNHLTKQWKLYQEFLARTRLFTRQSLENPAQHEVVAPAPWHVQLWLVDADCAFYDPASPTEHDQPISVHVHHVDTEEPIATLQQFSPPATALLTDLTETRPLIRTELTVKAPYGGHRIIGLVDCVATLDFVSEDFVRRFALQTRKSLTKTHVRLANGQRVTSSTVCDITFELARHEF
jgi:8-oxo-dGTP pyrophosphatase MutT (NUDIX family)